MNPKFSEGEVVIVQSPHYPETNGEYEVVQVFTYNEYREYCKHQFNSIGQPFVYRLKGYQAIGKINPDNKTDCASETSLRKKHLPGELDYKELMNSLKNPVLEWK